MPRNPLRILIASTPKTGNTWLKHMLAAVYELPVVDVPGDAGDGLLDGLPEHWIAHQHVAPTAALLRRVESHDLTVITCVRQPADALLSLFHHTQNYASDATLGVERAMCLDSGRPGPHTAAYVRTAFFGLLHVSAAWLMAPSVVAVRYEDLRRDTQAELQRITDRLRPVAANRISRVVDAHSLERMRRSQGDTEGRFFRSGNVGDGAAALPHYVLRDLATLPPYPELHAALGYSVPEGFSNASDHPGDPGGGLFDNGVPISPSVLAALDAAPADQRDAWRNPRSTGPGTFFDWLVSPAGPATARPIVTNLALAAHGRRADVQQRWPDPLGRDRAGFALWWVMRAAIESAVDACFIAPMLHSLCDWGAQASPSDPSPARVPITRLVEAVYEMRADVRVRFPDPFGADRIALLNWFVQHGCAEHGLGPLGALPVIRALLPRPPVGGQGPSTG